MIQAIVLGAGAGGGFPQWNSDLPGCRRARSGDPMALPRTQASLAVSGDGEHWMILNASPDIRIQIERTAALHPSGGGRSTPIVAVALTGAEVDCIAGLLTLREGQPFRLLAPASVLSQLDHNPIFDVVSRTLVPRIALPLDAAIAVGPAKLAITAFAVPGKAPLYDESSARSDPEGETVGLEIDDGVHRLLFIPGCAAMTRSLRERIAGADLLLFDATLWDDDEMIAAGSGIKTGRRMGHMSVGGPGGTIESLRAVSIGRKILVHLNNSNPALLADSGQRGIAEREGWEVAFDGMELTV